MADIVLSLVEKARRQARSSGHLQRAQTMVVAAFLCAFGLVAVAAALLAQVH